MRAKSMAMWVGLGLSTLTGGAYAGESSNQGFAYEDPDFLFELAPMSGVVLPDITVQNKTEKPMTVDFCHAVFTDSSGAAHKVMPCKVSVLAPGEVLHERVWIDGLSGGLPVEKAPASAPDDADTSFSMALPIHVRSDAFAIRAKFRLQPSDSDAKTAGGDGKAVKSNAAARAG
jgi:hypothetical protein